MLTKAMKKSRTSTTTSVYYKVSHCLSLDHTSTGATADSSKPTPAPPQPRTKIDYPLFSGDILDWEDFWSLFSTVIERDTALNDAECSVLLIKAMGSTKAREIATAAAQNTPKYDSAVSALKRHFGTPEQFLLIMFLPSSVARHMSTHKLTSRMLSVSPRNIFPE